MFSHTSVLLKESVDGLEICADGVYVDATFGRGGHSVEILKKLGPSGRIIAVDRDPEAIKFSKSFRDPRIQVFHSNFSQVPKLLQSLGLSKINGILFDLGVSSPQIESPQRGFSFVKKGPLDMRMNKNEGVSLFEWLSTASYEEIKTILINYGEERLAGHIASAICKKRETELGREGGLKNTHDLANLIKNVYNKKKHGKKLSIHPATKSFQAFRIFLNNEINELNLILKAIPSFLKIGGRVAIISFHSLEDRLVKLAIKSKNKFVTRKEGITSSQFALLRSISKEDKKIFYLKQIKKIKPSKEEIKINNRSRSAILRIAEMVKNNQQFNSEVKTF